MKNVLLATLMVLGFSTQSLAAETHTCLNKINSKGDMQFASISKKEALETVQNLEADNARNASVHMDDLLQIEDWIHESNIEVYTGADSGDAGFYINLVEKGSCESLFSDFIVNY